MNQATHLAVQLRTLRAVRARLIELEEAVLAHDLSGIQQSIERLDAATTRASEAFDTLAAHLGVSPGSEPVGETATGTPSALLRLRHDLATELDLLREQRARTLQLVTTLFALENDILTTLRLSSTTGTDYARPASDREAQRLIDASA
jgi:tetrahydromethanopterin S-methyltransferase subunit B